MRRTSLVHAKAHLSELVDHALAVALRGRLRGADAVYVWLASSRGLPLCTLDHEMAERATAFCKLVAP